MIETSLVVVIAWLGLLACLMWWLNSTKATHYKAMYVNCREEADDQARVIRAQYQQLSGLREVIRQHLVQSDDLARALDEGTERSCS